MDNIGWVKLHRKIIDNEIWRHDQNAWHVFEALLLIVDRGDGSWSGGRFQLGEMCGLHPSTIYRALKRLEKAKMVTLIANNKFTIISICKWSSYQEDTNSTSNNHRTTSEHSNKNKELRNKYMSDHQIANVYNHYIEAFNKNPNLYHLTPKRRKQISTRLADAGEEMLLKAITNLSKSDFHRGSGPRGWQADLDWLVKNYELVEKWATTEPEAMSPIKRLLEKERHELEA